MHTRIAATLLMLPALLALAKPPQASIGTPVHKAAPGTQTSGTQKPQHILTQSFPVAPKSATPKPATPKAAPSNSASAAKTPAPAKPAALPTAHQHPASKLPASASTLPGAINRNVIVLDPAHGGIDSGSRIGDSILEKDVALALAFKLRSLLTARGFNVIMTRDSDTLTADTPPAPGAPATSLALDDRAGIANHARPSACLLLHATGSGIGVHLYSSELDPAPAEAELLPWLTAQAAWVPQSKKLEKALATALNRARIPLVVSSASVRPVDSLTCPALVVELAPRTSDPATINDAGYQQRIAEAIATSLIFWQNQVQPPSRENEQTSASKAVQP
jgi:N-acetylmuramoyl-L-alanine amidase